MGRVRQTILDSAPPAEKTGSPSKVGTGSAVATAAADEGAGAALQGLPPDGSIITGMEPVASGQNCISPKLEGASGEAHSAVTVLPCDGPVAHQDSRLRYHDVQARAPSPVATGWSPVGTGFSGACASRGLPPRASSAPRDFGGGGENHPQVHFHGSHISDRPPRSRSESRQPFLRSDTGSSEPPPPPPPPPDSPHGHDLLSTVSGAISDVWARFHPSRGRATPLWMGGGGGSGSPESSPGTPIGSSSLCSGVAASPSPAHVAATSPAPAARAAAALPPPLPPGVGSSCSCGGLRPPAPLGADLSLGPCAGRGLGLGTPQVGSFPPVSGSFNLNMAGQQQPPPSPAVGQWPPLADTWWQQQQPPPLGPPAMRPPQPPMQLPLASGGSFGSWTSPAPVLPSAGTLQQPPPLQPGPLGPIGLPPAQSWGTLQPSMAAAPVGPAGFAMPGQLVRP